MSLLGDIRLHLERVHVSVSAAVLVGAPALVVIWLPSPWSYLTAAGWLVAAALVVRADLLAAVPPEGLRLRRELPPKLSIGVPNPVVLHVSNVSARAAALDVRETPPPGFEGERLFERVRLSPHSQETLAMRLTPPSRGSFRFGPVGVRSYGPRRLAAYRFEAPIPEEVSVYPDITSVRRVALAARRGLLRELGLRSVRLAGTGREFESLREYVDGDDFRDIDWKATARRGSPVVRRFEPERSQLVVLALDAGRMTAARADGRTKLDRAVDAALLLAYVGTRAGDNVGLLVFGRDVRTYLPPKRGHRQFLAILEALHSVESRMEEPDYRRALSHLAKRLSRRALVVVFTDVAGAEPSRRLLSTLSAMSPRHLPLVLTQRNDEVELQARAPVETEPEAFAAAVAEGVLREKAAALHLLSARGSLVLDVRPERLSVAAVNRYLEVKARGLL